MKTGEFYKLCESRPFNGMIFGPFDIRCLNCDRRIGAHSEPEFELCARRWGK
jgi:hypothetical protein